jgi:hypothetical protein
VKSGSSGTDTPASNNDTGGATTDPGTVQPTDSSSGGTTGGTDNTYPK